MPPPLVPPPASDIGAMTVPRYLQRWLDVNAITKLTRTSTFIQLLTFNQANSTWNGYSDIIFAFNFKSPNAISLSGITIPVSSNYALCISYKVQGIVTRYLLWDAVGSRLPETFTSYNGQPIKKNFRLEIWNTSQGAVSETTILNFYTSKLGPFDYRYGKDATLVNPDPVVSNFQNINSSISVPLPINSIGDFITTAGVTTSDSFHVTLWTDQLRGTTLTPNSVGDSSFNEGGGLENGSLVSLVNGPTGFMQGFFISNTIAMLISIDSPFPVGQLYSSGTNGLVISTVSVGSNRLFNAFGVTGTYPIVTGVPRTMYLLIADSLNGILYVINPQNGARLDTLVGIPINPTTGTYTVIGQGSPPNPTDPDAITTNGSEVLTGGQTILAQ